MADSIKIRYQGRQFDVFGKVDVPENDARASTCLIAPLEYNQTGVRPEHVCVWKNICLTERKKWYYV